MRLSEILAIPQVLFALVSVVWSWPITSWAQAMRVEVDLASRQEVEDRLRSVVSDNADRQRKLRDFFREAGCTGDALSEQVFNKKRPGNVLCTLTGESPSVIVVGAHSDHVEEGLGVVDDWSGASLLPTFYESLRARTLRHTFIFAAFAGEEMGLEGSRYFINSFKKSKAPLPKAMINLECLGLGPTKVWVSQSDKNLVQRLALMAEALHLPLAGVNVEQVGDSDSHPFKTHHIPAVDIHSVTQETISILHTPKDLLSAIDAVHYYESYRLIASYLVYLDSTLD